MARKPLFVLVAVLAALVGVTLWYLDYSGVIGDGSPLLWPREHFSREGWNGTSIEKRFVFYKDLKRSNLLVGKTRAEVIELLGPPNGDLGKYALIYNLSGFQDGLLTACQYRAYFNFADDRVASSRVRCVF